MAKSLVAWAGVFALLVCGNVNAQVTGTVTPPQPTENAITVNLSSAPAPAAATSTPCGCGTSTTTSSCDGGCGDTSCGLSGCGRLGNLFRSGRVRSMLSGLRGLGGCNSGCETSCDPCGNSCGTYRTIFGGWNFLEDYEADTVPAPVGGTFNDGFVLGFARGRSLNCNTRIETEFAWRNNTGDVWTNTAGATTAFDGQINNYSSMVNLIRDFDKVYVGGGLGVSRQSGEFLVGGNSFEMEDWAFAFQAFIGANINQSMFVEYRYFGNTETDLNLNDAFFDNFEYNSHNVIIGFRF